MSDDDRRRSLRQQLPPSPYTIPSSDRHQRNTSSLQLQLERAIDSPGGIARTVHLINSRATKDREIEELNQQNWSPLVKAIFRFGCRTTKKGNTTASEEQLDHLIRVCRQRGISMNSGAYFGGQFHRPLIVAAYYGYYSAVQLLIELGALPNLRDGIGRNVLFAALENPTDSGKHYLRECDKRTAQILVDLGVLLLIWDCGDNRPPKPYVM
jgi:predicted nucleic acid-binding Zn ribbon protein